VEVEYPFGHPRRRGEGIPLLIRKFRENLMTRFAEEQTEEIVQLMNDRRKFEGMTVNEFMELFVPQKRGPKR
jgi:2-methylcitrate dehydratase